MVISLFKKISITYFFLICINLNADMMLDANDKLDLPLPLPYDGNEISVEEVNKFLSQSIAENKQPIIIFGANWCPDCRILSAVLDLKTVNKYMEDNFEILYIDLGRYDINMSLMEFFDIMPQQGIPRVVILNKDKEVLNIKDTGEWTTARSRTKQEIFNYFQEYKE